MKVLISILIFVFISGCDFRDTKRSKNEKIEIVREVRSKVALELKKEWNLIPFGTAGQMMDQIKMIGLAFQYFEPIDIESGRKLLVASVNKFIFEINSDDRIRPYLNNYPFDERNIEIRIFVYSSGCKDVELGEISLLKAVDGILEYAIRSSNKNQLTTIYRETYEEAVKKIKTQQ